MPAIETKSLSKSYNGFLAVDNLSLSIEEGEIFGLLGPNGAGKTTTLMMLATLRPPSSGFAKINGFDVVKQPDKVRKSIGIVFQDPSSDDILTGYENLKLHAMLYDVPDALAKKRIEEVLRLVGLSDRKNDRVKKYSGGMRRRLELARGLVHHPKILFLDEPTLGLDPQARDNIWEYIQKLAKEEKITIILTTHYMEEADKLCDRIAIIDMGKIVAIGSPKQLKKALGDDTIRVKAKKPNIEALEKKDFVKKITACDDGICITVKDVNKHLQEILATIGPIETVEVHSPTLEDVFLHYTGKTLRDDSPEGGWGDRVMRVVKK